MPTPNTAQALWTQLTLEGVEPHIARAVAIESTVLEMMRLLDDIAVRQVAAANTIAAMSLEEVER